jgi:hypothetical protein
MPSCPNFASVALICCSFCSFSLCGCYLSDVQAPALGAFALSLSEKLFHNLVAQFVGVANRSLYCFHRNISSFVLLMKFHRKEKVMQMNMIVQALWC